MNHDEDEGRQLLAPLRAVEPDIRTGVDIAKAKQAGRRTGRRRVIAGVAAAASLAVLAALGVPTVVSNLSEQVSPANIKGDLFKQLVEVGTPGGFTPQSYMSTPTYQVVVLRRTDGGEGTAVVEVLRPGVAPGDAEKRQAAPDVNGGKAYWTGYDLGILMWKWPGEGYATVHSDALFPDIKDRLHHIAQAVRPAAKPMSVPFTVPRDDSLTVRSISAHVGQATASASFTHLTQAGPSSVSVVLAPTEKPIQTPSTVGGRPAWVEPNAVKIPDVVPGYMLAVTTDAMQGEGEYLVRLAESVRLVDDVNDRGTWPSGVWR
ncbi:hypothetical protein [Kibdelosporangium phytohabitans]|uniref:Uncharacterized protein n=1 Tax=Kibdelosporangium phytohabitans TaxID=860235 RepID=A0A0N7F2K1_9PSEU|nr:hypothetical protein [Kibdelosporangium phytohabitans]ALG06055.1 hypothetical protein AOZ06_03195 [Kibdelosporangium phytohabitans]MBE1465866.1 hypothetical protein [Kibdelosporangium phytohabitans]